MMADTTFLIHLAREYRRGLRGRARAFLAKHRAQAIRTSIISLTEASVSFTTSDAAWDFFKRWPVQVDCRLLPLLPRAGHFPGHGL